MGAVSMTLKAGTRHPMAACVPRHQKCMTAAGVSTDTDEEKPHCQN
jgi:hypothetical protein